MLCFPSGPLRLPLPYIFKVEWSTISMKTDWWRVGTTFLLPRFRRGSCKFSSSDPYLLLCFIYSHMTLVMDMYFMRCKQNRESIF